MSAESKARAEDTSPTDSLTDSASPSLDLSTGLSYATLESSGSWAPHLVPKPEDFLARYRTQAFDLTKNVYVSADRSLRITPAGALSINLCEDVVYLLNAQVEALDEYLSALEASNDSLRSAATEQEGREGDNGDIRSEGVSSLLHALYVRQIASRDTFLIDLEGCCAAANDFYRLAESLEGWANELGECRRRRSPASEVEYFSKSLMEERELPDLIRLLVSDAEYAVRLSCLFVLDEECLRDSGASGLCEREWEEDDGAIAPCGSATSGRALSSLVAIVEEYLGDIEEYMGEENLFRKAIEAMIRRTAIIYLDSLLRRMESLRRKREGRTKYRREVIKNDSCHESSSCGLPFADPAGASRHMRDDIYVLKTLFKSWVLEIPALDLVIEKEFAAATAMQKCVDLGGNIAKIGSDGSCDFVAALSEISCVDVEILRRVIMDLWGLTVAYEGAVHVDLPFCIEEEISKIGKTSHSSNKSTDNGSVSLRFYLPGLSVHELLMANYGNENERTDKILRKKPSYLSSKMSRRQLAKTLKADVLAARRKLGKVPLSKKKIKKRARTFLKTCKQAGKLKKN